MYLRESKQQWADGSMVTYLLLAENAWDAAKRPSQASIVHNCGRGGDPEPDNLAIFPSAHSGRMNKKFRR